MVWDPKGIGAAAPAATLADAVMSNIHGCQDAQAWIYTLRQGCAPADALLEALDQERATGDVHRLRGFVRELQKAIERSVA